MDSKALEERVIEIRERLNLNIYPWDDIPNDIILLAFVSPSGYRKLLPAIRDELMDKYHLKNYDFFEFIGDRILSVIAINIMLDHIGHNALIDNFYQRRMTLLYQEITKNSTLYCIMKTKSLCSLIIRDNNSSEKVCADVLEAILGGIYYYKNIIKGELDILWKLTTWYSDTFNIAYIIDSIIKNGKVLCEELKSINQLNKIKPDRGQIDNSIISYDDIMNPFDINKILSYEEEELQIPEYDNNYIYLPDWKNESIDNGPSLEMSEIKSDFLPLVPSIEAIRTVDLIRKIPLRKTNKCNFPYNQKYKNISLPLNNDYERFQYFIKSRKLSNSIKQFSYSGGIMSVLYLSENRRQFQPYVCAWGKNIDISSSNLLTEIVKHFNLSFIPVNNKYISGRIIYPYDENCNYQYDEKNPKVGLPLQRYNYQDQESNNFLRLQKITGFTFDGRYILIGNMYDFKVIGILYRKFFNKEIIPIYCSYNDGYESIKNDLINAANKYMGDAIDQDNITS